MFRKTITRWLPEMLLTSTDFFGDLLFRVLLNTYLWLKAFAQKNSLWLLSTELASQCVKINLRETFLLIDEKGQSTHSNKLPHDNKLLSGSYKSGRGQKMFNANKAASNMASQAITFCSRTFSNVKVLGCCEIVQFILKI